MCNAMELPYLVAIQMRCTESDVRQYADAQAIAYHSTMWSHLRRTHESSVSCFYHKNNVSGFTNGEFQTLLIDVPQIETAVADSRVAGVSLTGSTRAGKSIGALAGKYVKRCVLELGGSDPFLVLHDADIPLVLILDVLIIIIGR